MKADEVTPKRRTPVQKPVKRKLNGTTPFRRKPGRPKAPVKETILKKIFIRRKPHPRSPTLSAKKLLATGRSPNCFSLKTEFHHTTHVMKPVIQTEGGYEAVSKMIHITHDDVKEQIERVRVGKRSKYPKREGSYLDRHQERLLRRQQAVLGAEEKENDCATETDIKNEKNGKIVIRQLEDGSIYAELGSHLVICEQPPTVNVTMMSAELAARFLASRSKPDFKNNPFYHKLSELTIKSIRNAGQSKEQKKEDIFAESEQ